MVVAGTAGNGLLHGLCRLSFYFYSAKFAVAFSRCARRFFGFPGSRSVYYARGFDFSGPRSRVPKNAHGIFLIACLARVITRAARPFGRVFLRFPGVSDRVRCRVVFPGSRREFLYRARRPASGFRGGATRFPRARGPAADCLKARRFAIVINPTGWLGGLGVR